MDETSTRIPESESEPQPAPGSAARGLFRFIGWTATVALVAVLALCAVLIVHRRFENGPPDVAGIARSQPAAAADHAVASEISAALRSLAPAGASWLASGPTAVTDYCFSGPADSFGPSWTPTSCLRMVGAYFFSDDPPQHDVQTWDATLRSSGWSVAADPSRGSDESSRVLDTSLVSLGYSAHLTFDWTPLSQATDPTDGSAGRWPVAGAGAGAIVVWNQETTMPPDVAESAAFSRYRFVARVTVTVWYFDSADSADGAASLPTPTGDGRRGQCVTGSDSCD